MPRSQPPLRLRRGTEAAIAAAFAAAPADFEVGEPIYATDTGKVMVKKSDGTLGVIAGSGSGSGGLSWGLITGTLSSQTDLQAALNAKASTSHGHTFADVAGNLTLAKLPVVTDPTKTYNLRYVGGTGWSLVEDAVQPPPPSSGTQTIEEAHWLSTQFLDANQNGVLVDQTLIFPTFTPTSNAAPTTARVRTWVNTTPIRWAYYAHRFIGTGTNPGYVPVFSVPGIGISIWSDCGTRVVGTNAYRIWRAPSQWDVNYSYSYTVT